MKLAIVLYSNDPETVWNAFRLAEYSIKKDDKVDVFLLARGVECESLDGNGFDVSAKMQSLVEAGGRISACGTCLELRKKSASEYCPMSTMADLYEIIQQADRLVTF